MARIRRGPPPLLLASLLASLLGALACGRTPVWLPCGTPEDDDGVPAPSCEHPACRESTTARLVLPPTNALIVLDRSCSMAVVTDGRTKWSRAVEAVSAMVVDPRAQWLRWGLTLFPDGDTDGVQGPILVPVAPGQSEAIAELLIAALERDDPNHPNQPGEPCFTNLAAAVDQIGASSTFGGLDGRNHVILITDGLAGAEQVALDLELLFDGGTPTFVVGFGDLVNHSTL
ncbi:MAG: hypothetical protein KDK70_36860, partial [Myxococcales bacterium]|nr:hypothetical protein [Myxococcales bacterium]